ncbi:MAG: ABC transporter permease [Propionicimonas sp.]|uniref:ABC transporter permease n=1 Tax=Propionicimonas sp. TaxID=1955623 RepID=UPI002B1EEDEE|nr:ABC transporter permease [Propionicimonas sp.]MEA4945294.1 ABC transporter permease [Propionicimonas sp.]MEA5052923.1 ABC transporter permease [Propionicimonas sp.]MEA5117229.1 ABC transporter permease [Propionicimonas sp.]
MTNKLLPDHPAVAIDTVPAPHQSLWRRALAWEGTGLLGVLVLVFIVLCFIAPNFFTAANMLNILQQAAFFGIVAFAMTLVIVAGEIDVSVGSSAALTSSLVAYFVAKLDWPMWLSALIAILIAVAMGAMIGWLRDALNVPTFIGTLALYLALRGAAYLVTNTFPIPVESDKFFYWGSSTGKVFGIVPVPALYFLAAFIVVALIARYTVFGRSVYAVGGNANASALSGVNVRRIRVLVMCGTAFAAAITGLLQTAQLASGNSTIAQGLEFDAIAAAVIGGTAMSGGRGTISGTLIGVLFVAILLNGMVMLGLNPYVQQVVRGCLVLFAVLVNVARTRKTAAA